MGVVKPAAGAVVVGVDIGQRSDPTALCVAELERRDGVAHWIVRRLERLPLGSPYPAVAERLAAVVAAVAERTGTAPTVFVDATGVGQPVVDLLQTHGRRVTPVYFTHGDRRTVEADGSVKLGKAWLVSRLQALLQTGRVHLPRTAEAEALARELLDYEIRVSQNANDTYGAFKVGTHDDLVTALGLAVQVAPTVPAVFGSDPDRVAEVYAPTMPRRRW